MDQYSTDNTFNAGNQNPGLETPASGFSGITKSVVGFTKANWVMMLGCGVGLGAVLFGKKLIGGKGKKVISLKSVEKLIPGTTSFKRSMAGKKGGKAAHRVPQAKARKMRSSIGSISKSL